jgi:YjbE family integral membrane protein
MLEFIQSSAFWVGLGQIIMINILLSGDNAVVIALASRSLPPKQQKAAILFGSFGAIVLRVILTFFAVMLLALPFLKLIGAALLVWIGVKMLIPEEEEEHIDASTQLWAAIKTIIIADFVMSLDNVLGVAAAAKGSLLLLIIGLGVSIPIIVYGSTLVLKLMTRWPVIVTAGGGLLGWVAGEMAVSDPAIEPMLRGGTHWLHDVMPALGAILVVLWGKAHVALTVAAARRTLDAMPPEVTPEPPPGYRWQETGWGANFYAHHGIPQPQRVAVPISSRMPVRGRWGALRDSYRANPPAPPKAPQPGVEPKTPGMASPASD